MLTGHALQSILALHDLPHLVASLGHEPLWEPLDVAALDLGRRSDSLLEAAIVGRLGGFTWYAVASDNPTHHAPRIAKRLAERGRMCGVFGLDQAERQLAVSVAFDGTPTLEVNLARPSQLATSCLARIGRAESGGSLGIASRTAEALSGTGLGRKFFAAFRATLDRIMAALPASIPARHRHELGLLQLTRVLFLYFVQAKGWLNGSDQFLRMHVDDCLFHRRAIHRHLLLPLFFGTLNQPHQRRNAAARRFGRVPFLNGGLFEPHPLEEQHQPDIPDAIWRDAFDTLFERYHFTISEATPGSIAPDMLGRVFEGVMEPGARKQSGTFYTPRALVRAVLDAALAGFISGQLGISEAEALRRLEAGEAQAVQLLDDIAILDPAAGSGAFLLGALERLTALHAAAGRDAPPRRIVARNLFGVDLNPAAVRLCELRLWLAILSTEPDGPPAEVEPLPNLDAYVRQGDSLADPLRLMLRHPLRASRHAAALEAARRAAAVASGVPKREAFRLLRRVELDAALERLDQATVEREREVRSLVEAGKEPTLFGGRKGLDARARVRLKVAREEVRALRRARRRLREDGVAPSFDFDTHFGDVTARGGFDLVVGNPPWVRAEALPAGVRTGLRERFRWWRAGRGPGYRHQPDLAVAFLERGWELTRPGGILAMLVPAKVATAAYGSTARAALSERGTVLSIADLTRDPAAAFEATTYPLAIVVRSSPPPAGHRPQLGLHPGIRTSSPPSPYPGAPWVLQSGALQQTLVRLRGVPTLSETVRIRLGVKTGANHLFLSPADDIELELVRPVLRGKDLQAFSGRPSNQMIWTHDPLGAVLPSLPPNATRHFTNHLDALRARRDDGGPVPWSLFRASAGRRVPRVVWPDLSLRLEAACLVDEEEFEWVPLNSCYVVLSRSTGAALALGAWLNSTWVRAAARATADPASGGYARFNARAVGSVPLPPDALDDAQLTALARRGRAGEEVQGELDEVVGAWLQLRPHDRGVLSEVVGVGTARVVAEGLRPLIDPLPGLLAPGPAAAPGAVARAISATLAPPRAPDDAPGWLDPSQAEAYTILLHSLRHHGAVLCADPVGSGKTYVALALAQAHDNKPAVCVVPPALQEQWRATARRLGVEVTIWSHALLSRGRLPTGKPSLVILDESHHFRHQDIRRYRTLAPWLVGRKVLLLSATPIVNRPRDLYHQLHLGLRDDALVDHGAVSLRTAFNLDTVPPALGRFVVQREATATVPRRHDRCEVLQSGAVSILPALDALKLSRNPEVAALVRTVLLHAAASSPAAALATLRRYRLLLLQAQDATAGGVPPSRRSLQRILGKSHDQLVMWSLMPGAESGGELCLDDLPPLDHLIAKARRAAERPDAKASRLAELLHQDRQTLVYVTSCETISYLRRHLPDRWLAWCRGQRSGIGSTTLPREAVLRWFRPDAPCHPPGAPGRPTTLLTTDVTAEGLDLQGAGRVIHYDLPWTDVRMAQRDGRAIRQGSKQAAVEVVRFLPEHGIEHRLHQVRHLTRKSTLPGRYGLGPAGQTRWRWRGEVAGALTGAGMEGIGAVHSSQEGALAGVVLERDGQPVVSTALVRVSRSRWVPDPATIRARLHEAAHGTPLSPPSVEELRDCLVTLAPTIRSLMRHASLSRVAGVPASPAARALGGRLRQLATGAARRRDAGLLVLLEGALCFSTRGHTAGEALLIESLMSLGDSDLVARLEHLPRAEAPPAPVRPRLTGLIVFRGG